MTRELTDCFSHKPCAAVVCLQTKPFTKPPQGMRIRWLYFPTKEKLSTLYLTMTWPEHPFGREVPRWWGWRQSLVLRLKEQPDHSVYLDHQHLVRLLEPSSESFLSERLSGDLPRQQSVLQSPGCWRRKGYVCTCMCVWNSPKTVSRSQCRSGERGSDLTHSD